MGSDGQRKIAKWLDSKSSKLLIHFLITIITLNTFTTAADQKIELTSAGEGVGEFNCPALQSKILIMSGLLASQQKNSPNSISVVQSISRKFFSLHANLRQCPWRWSPLKINYLVEGSMRGTKHEAFLQEVVSSPSDKRLTPLRVTASTRTIFFLDYFYSISFVVCVVEFLGIFWQGWVRGTTRIRFLAKEGCEICRQRITTGLLKCQNAID